MQYPTADIFENEENLSEEEKLDNAFHDMEMLYRSRCVDVPLASNVTVHEIDEDKNNQAETEKN